MSGNQEPQSIDFTDEALEAGSEVSIKRKRATAASAEIRAA